MKLLPDATAELTHPDSTTETSVPQRPRPPTTTAPTGLSPRARRGRKLGNNQPAPGEKAHPCPLARREIAEYERLH